MGAVYQVSHLRLPRRFAVKVLTPELTNHPEALARFQREAQVTSDIGHPHILEIIDFNKTDDGTPYIVMEFLEGEDLAARIRREGALKHSRAVSIFRQLASALEAAHRRGVVHRDLKPENIFLCKRGERDDYVKVLDFGISKVLGSKSHLTRADALVGTPHYMSPEQAERDNAEVDLRTDVHAMGAILFEMLAGTPPFNADSVPRLLYMLVHTPAPSLRSIRPEAPRALESVIATALSKDPADRFPSMLEFWQAVATALKIDTSEEEFTEDRGGDWADASKSITGSGDEPTTPRGGWAPDPDEDGPRHTAKQPQQPARETRLLDPGALVDGEARADVAPAAIGAETITGSNGGTKTLGGGWAPDRTKDDLRNEAQQQQRPVCETGLLDPGALGDGKREAAVGAAAIGARQDESSERSNWSDPDVGQRLANYVVSSFIGEGRTGAVYLATNPQIGQVAIKVLASHLCQQPGLAERFTAEIRAIAHVAHPNIIQIHDFGQDREGRLYYVMELLNGRELSAILDEDAPMPPERAMTYLEQMCHGLQAAHDAGVVHGDLKPKSILVIERQVKILDFGHGMLRQASHLGTKGMVIGSPLTASPEQAAGRTPLGPATDIYSLGVILYWMLAGRPPFMGEEPAVILAQHIKEIPPSVSEFADIPAAVAEVVHACLAKDPEERLRSARIVAAAFAEALRLPPGSGAASDQLPQTEEYLAPTTERELPTAEVVPTPFAARSAEFRSQAPTTTTTLKGAAGELDETLATVPAARLRRMLPWFAVVAALLGGVTLWVVRGGTANETREKPIAAATTPLPQAMPTATPMSTVVRRSLVVRSRQKGVECLFTIVAEGNSKTVQQKVPCRIDPLQGATVTMVVSLRGYHPASMTLKVSGDLVLGVRRDRRRHRLRLVRDEDAADEPLPSWKRARGKSSAARESAKPAGIRGPASSGAEQPRRGKRAVDPSEQVDPFDNFKDPYAPKNKTR